MLIAAGVADDVYNMCMSNLDNKSNTKTFIILGAVMAVVSVFLFCASILGDLLHEKCSFLLFATMPLAINGFAYLVKLIVSVFRDKDPELVLPLTSLAVSLISGIIGLISYINNHKLILGDLEAMLIWFFISIPALVVAVIHFILSYIRMSRRVNAQGKGEAET